jgi:plasmid stabilization system protein ParE
MGNDLQTMPLQVPYQLSEEAEEDRMAILQGLVLYRTERATQKFLDALEDKIRAVCQSPGIGLSLQEGVYRTNFLGGEYLLHYRVAPQGVIILQLFPTARHPQALRYS